jgi:UDP-2,3-diacylglucosamine hydrolase
MPNSTDECLKISSADVFFVSDSHFRSRALPGEAERRDRFVRFLETIPDRSTLLLLGDIFDFYFEYRTVVPNRFFDVFFALHSCRKRGIELHFLGGNHDCWAGDFLRRDLEVRVHDADFLMESQGRRIRCAHGDLLLPDDGGYRVLRSILRHPVMIALARLLHPDLLSRVASGVSGESKKHKRRTQEETAHRVAAIAGGVCYRWGNDAFVMGHVHHPLLRVIDGRDFVIIGDWIDHFSYARLSGGKILLERFIS